MELSWENFKLMNVKIGDLVLYRIGCNKNKYPSSGLNNHHPQRSRTVWSAAEKIKTIKNNQL